MSYKRTIWNCYLNANTFNFDGLEWVVDGEIGRRIYPGSWAECTVREYYQNGWNYNHHYPDPVARTERRLP